MKKYIFVITTLIFLGASTAMVFGQSFNTEPAITITANPSDPEPGENVVITLSSYETNLDLTYIKWSSNSDSNQGYGEKVWRIKMGSNINSTTLITAEITMPNGTKILKELSLTPSQLDIAWEAKDSKAPPFYMGKRIPIRENSIRVAVLNQDPVKSKQTAYYWSRNGKALQNSSGTAKTFVDFKNTELDKTENINISLVSTNNKMERDIKIPMQAPKLLFYEYHPVLGLGLNKTIKDSALGYDGTTSVYAVPLGLNAGNRNVVSWNLSKTDVNNQENPYLLSFGVPDENGIVPIGVKIENLGTLYQEFFGSLRLNF